LFGAIGTLIGMKAYAAVKEAKEGERLLREAQAEATALDFNAATGSMDAAIAALDRASEDMRSLRIVRAAPVLGTQIRAGDGLLTVAQETAMAIRELLLVGDAALTSFTGNEDQTPSSFSPEEREQILAAIANGREGLERAAVHMTNARTAFETIPERGLLGPVRAVTADLAGQLPVINEVIENALPFTRILPALAGYPDGTRYLFLLQNNQELRPTGGFIGTYGILQVQNGDIARFETDNIYNLDEAAKDRVSRTPPPELARYLAAGTWFLRDANWSPNFPDVSALARAMYQEESGSREELNGVIAITPKVVQDLLTITGPITVDGVEFSDENVLDELRFQVDQGFLSRGESGNERKGIIGSLGGALVDRLENLPQQRWVELWGVISENLQQRHLLIAMDDIAANEVLHAHYWDGAVRPAPGDSLLVVDANLASLKTDAVIQRTITHEIDLESGVSTVTLTYAHTGEFSSTITRYRTYTRLYVPLGSTLVSSEGFYTNDKLQGGRPADADIGIDLGRAVFGGFLSVEPGESATVTLAYRLPEGLLDQLRAGGYTLLAQKQAGVEGAHLTSTVKLGKSIQRVHPLELVQRKEKDQVVFDTAFAQDAEFTVLP
jgi:hypothetical protein